MAAGLGLEPRYHDPESWVLPLDDPARYRYHTAFGGKNQKNIGSCMFASI